VLNEGNKGRPQATDTVDLDSSELLSDSDANSMRRVGHEDTPVCFLLLFMMVPGNSRPKDYMMQH